MSSNFIVEPTDVKPNRRRSSPLSSLRNRLRTRNGKLLGIIVILLLLAAIPLTLFVARQQQELRQHAAEVTCPSDSASDVILVIDTSNSMAGSKLKAAKDAAKSFVTQLLPAGTKNRVGIATFDNNGGLNRGLTNKVADLTTTINGLQVPGDGKGGTCLECAIDKRGSGDVRSAFANTSTSTNKRHVIILTDGNINRWMKDDGTILGSTGAGDEQKARDQALGAIKGVSTTFNVAFWAVHYGALNHSSYLKNDIVATYDGTGQYFASGSETGWLDTYNTIANILNGGTVVAEVYEDLNKNGTFEVGETPLQYVDVKLVYDADPTNAETKQTGADGKATFANRCNQPQTLTVTPLDGYEMSPAGTESKQIQSVTEGATETRQFLMKRMPNATQLTCTPAEVTIDTTDQTITATLKDSTGTPLAQKSLTWSSTDSNLLFSPDDTSVVPSVTPTAEPTAIATPTTAPRGDDGSSGFGGPTGSPTPTTTPRGSDGSSGSDGTTLGAATAFTPTATTNTDSLGQSIVHFKYGTPLTGDIAAQITASFPENGIYTKASCAVAATYTPPPPEMTFTADPTLIDSGQQSTLTWTAKNVTSCTADNGWTGPKDIGGGSEQTGPLTESKTYSLSCAGLNGDTVSDDVTVDVRPTLTFTGDPTTVTSGGSSTLTWTSTNTTSCTASGDWTGEKELNGTEPTGPLTENKTYTLTCTSPVGDVTKTVPITVITPNTTVLNLDLLLHGIGISGDNVVLEPAQCKRTNGVPADPEGCLSNETPLHPERNITVEIFNKDNSPQATVSGTIAYNDASGTFKGTANLGTNWQTGVYNIKVTSPSYLRRQIPGFHTITADETYDVPRSDLVSSDVDGDNALTILDYSLIISCYTFPGMPPTCPHKPDNIYTDDGVFNILDANAILENGALVDVNDDGKNDEFDENLFRRDLIVQYGQ